MKTANPSSGSRTSLGFALALALFAQPAAFRAQSVPESGAASAVPANRGNPTWRETPPVTLSVFEVTAEQDRGYAAASAMSGTQTNEQLANLPNSISVMTADFLADIAALDFFDAADFAVGAENIYNDQGTQGAAIGTRSGNQLTFRGLPAARQLRDGFPWYMPQDIFNTERIEFNRGPGGLAYGDVDAGGIINLGSKRASWGPRKVTLQTRFDQWGTKRASLDVQQPLRPSTLALRLNLVNSDVHHWHQGYDTKLKAYAAAVRWKVGSRTELAVLGERGFQDRGLSHLALTDMTAAYIRGTGTNALDANPAIAGVQTDGEGMFRTQAPGNTQRWNLIRGTLFNLESTATATFRNSRVQEGSAASNLLTNPKLVPRRPMAEAIVPRDEDWGGPQHSTHPNWSTYTLELRHEVSRRLHFLLAHNSQRDRTTRDLVFTGNNQETFGGRSVFIDVNPSLPNPDGTATLVPNPRYEKLYITHNYAPVDDGHDIRAHRGVGVYDLPLPRGISQRLVGSATYRTEQFFRNAYHEALTEAEIARRGLTGAAATLPNNLVYRYHYLADGNAPATLTESLLPGVTRLVRNNANGTNARFEQSLTTIAVNALGSYFNGRLRTSLGVSRDRFHQRSANTLNLPGTGEITFADAAGRPLPPDQSEYPVFSFSRQWATNQTYGVVYHARPWVSLTAAYLQSSQFTDNLFINLNGAPLGPLLGEGYDVGARFNLWADRLSVAYTRYETIGKNFRAAVPNNIRDELNVVLPVGQRVVGGNSDTRSRKTRGDEVEIFFSPSRNWTGRLAYSTARVVNSDSFPLLAAAIAEAKAAARAAGLDPITATQQSEQLIADDLAEAALARATVNFTTRYSFSEGKLKGWVVGLSGRFTRGTPRAAQIINTVVVLPDGLTADDYVFNPFFSYRRTFGRVGWTGQLNLNNLFDRVTEQGTAYRFVRYTNPRQIILTNTFSF
jgi:outer membrane receptor for ferric coprogen and ferric-rhodotorulic acid